MTTVIFKEKTLVTAFEHYLEDNLPTFLAMLEEMVKINSFTSNAQGVNALGKLTAKKFAALNFTAEYIQASSFMFGKHLVLTRNGRSANGAPPPTIGLISHLDTVYPEAEEIENNFSWHIEGERIYGPGTFDIKGGTIMIYIIMAALQAIDPDFFNRVNWVILLNAAEEELVTDFGQLCQERLGRTALAALVFEGGEETVDRTLHPLVVSRKGMARYHIEVEGKSAHAGTSHEQGANAILQMAQVVQQIADFTDYKDEITFNVGTIAGGTVINRVPHKASSFVEMRAFSPAVFATGVKKMVALNNYSTVSSANGGYPCRVQVDVLGEWDPWAPNDASNYLLALWRETGVKLGMTVEPQARGGLSDGNWMWHLVPTMDGLGPDGGNAHCSERSADGSKEQEYISPASFIPKALLNITAIKQLVKNHYEVR